MQLGKTIALQPALKLSLQTGHYVRAYLAACAGAELRAPAAGPEHRPLPGPLQTARLQLLQAAGLQRARGLCRAVRHFIMSPFDWRTPLGCFLNIQVNMHNMDEPLLCAVTGGR